jgi:hypothetical protein
MVWIWMNFGRSVNQIGIKLVGYLMLIFAKVLKGRPEKI